MHRDLWSKFNHFLLNLQWNYIWIGVPLSFTRQITSCCAKYCVVGYLHKCIYLWNPLWTTFPRTKFPHRLVSPQTVRGTQVIQNLALGSRSPWLGIWHQLYSQQAHFSAIRTDIRFTIEHTYLMKQCQSYICKTQRKSMEMLCANIAFTSFKKKTSNTQNRWVNAWAG